MSHHNRRHCPSCGLFCGSLNHILFVDFWSSLVECCVREQYDKQHLQITKFKQDWCQKDKPNLLSVGPQLHSIVYESVE
jgi:hypothetical protein